MFKPTTKKKVVKPKEKANFKLEFHASRIPQRGWDKLLVSLISVETGRVISKTGKVAVKNGTCHWTEVLQESANVPLDISGKDSDKELYKLVVSMGLSRFGILGETTISLADYAQAIAAPVSLSLPLQNCNAGSILHVKIRRTMPKSVTRDLEGQTESNIDQEVQLDTVGQLTQFDTRLSAFDSLQQSELGKRVTPNKDESSPPSAPRYSSDSFDIPSTPGVSESRPYGSYGVGEELTSPSSSISSCSGRPDSGNGFNDYIGFNKLDDAHEVTSERTLTSSAYQSKSLHDNGREVEQWNAMDTPSFQSRERSSSMWIKEDYNGKIQATSCVRNSGQHVELDAAEVTAKEPSHQEANAWEQHEKLLGIEIEALRKQLMEEMKKSEELNSKFCAVTADRDCIKQELENIKSSEQPCGPHIVLQNVKELWDELEYEKGVNSNLSLQLRKTQESNSELLLEIQDLEKLVQEKAEREENVQVKKVEADEDLKQVIDALKKELEDVEKDLQELTEENLDLLSQLKQANDELKGKDQLIVELELKNNHGTSSQINMSMDEQSLAAVSQLKEDVDILQERLRTSEKSFENKFASSRALVDDLNASVLVLRTKNSHLERQLQSSEDHVSELINDMEKLKIEISEHEKEKSLLASQKGQLKGLREKATKAEQDHTMALKQLKELESINMQLKEEKNQANRALEVQLDSSEELRLAAIEKYKSAMQMLDSLKAEKSGLEKEVSMLIKAKEEAECTMQFLQNENRGLQEKLSQEALMSASLLQDNLAKSTDLLQDLNATQLQLKDLEVNVKQLEAARKDLEFEASNLQEENVLYKTQIKGLELHVASLKEDRHVIQSSLNAKIGESERLNAELSEKLNNAREEVDWNRENTNKLLNEIRALEAGIESGHFLRNQLEQFLSELEGQKATMQSRVEKLSDENLQLKEESKVQERRWRDAVNQNDALLVSLQTAKDFEDSLRAVSKQQEDRIQQLLTSNEKKQTLSESAVLGADNASLEEKLRKLQEELDQANKIILFIKENSACQELDMVKRLEEAGREVQVLKDDKQTNSQRVMELEAKYAILQQEKGNLIAEMAEIKAKSEGYQLWKMEAEKAKTSLAASEQDKTKVDASLEKVSQEVTLLKEQLKSQEETANRWKQTKTALEEKIAHLQEASTKASWRPLEEKNSEVIKLRKQTSDLKCKLSEQEVEKDDLRKTVFLLEEELQCKVNALAFAERKLKEREPSANGGGSSVSLIARSLSRANSKVGPISGVTPSRDAKELIDLRGKVKLLELEVKGKVAELETSKQQLREQQIQLSGRIELLEMTNEQLVKERSHSNMELLIKEVNSLQNQNEALYQRENELLSKLSSQEALLSELEGLKEEKKQLENALFKFNAAVNGDNLMKRISVLETELAEVLEANNMYKSQLQSAFAKQQNVHAAALENMGSVDQVLKDLTDLKRKNLELDDELRDMRERYFNMSIQFAEVEAEREELVMTIRNFRGAKKLLPYKSANF